MIPVYVENIKYSLQNKCFFAALSLALTLPDICGMAEFPDKSVGGRYIEWYDKYLGMYMLRGKNHVGGDNPWLSGEVVYNLRNTYLHQGSPNVIGTKVKESANQIDRFVLVLGDGTLLGDISMNMESIDMGYEKLAIKGIIVDVTYLCNNICDCALWYYENNVDKFSFNFNVVTQEEWMNPSQETRKFAQEDFIAKILNQKFESQGSSLRIVEETDRIKNILSNTNVKIEKEIGVDTEIRTAEEGKKKNVSRKKKEAQVRSFFGRHFKKKLYIEKKEVIIQSVLKSETKLQVNNNLMKYFSGKDVSRICQILEPLIKDLPGK